MLQVCSLSYKQFSSANKNKLYFLSSIMKQMLEQVDMS